MTNSQRAGFRAVPSGAARRMSIDDCGELVRIRHCAEIADVSEFAIRQAIKHGTLAHRKLGRLTFVPRSALCDFLGLR